MKAKLSIFTTAFTCLCRCNPYKQAYQRGVKIIGATAHFVNKIDIRIVDEGPIIYQDITKIHHAMDWKEMQKHGRDCRKDCLI